MAIYVYSLLALVLCLHQIEAQNSNYQFSSSLGNEYHCFGANIYSLSAGETTTVSGTYWSQGFFDGTATSHGNYISASVTWYEVTKPGTMHAELTLEPWIGTAVINYSLGEATEIIIPCH